MEISCVDLFCGMGGLTYGLEKEGINVKAGVDVDPACEFAYVQNNKAKFVLRDVKKLSGNDLSSIWPRSEIRLLAGCAPCQPFSSYSQRYDGNNNHKWGLLDQFSRLVRSSSCLLYTSPSPRDKRQSRMPSSA